MRIDLVIDYHLGISDRTGIAKMTRAIVTAFLFIAFICPVGAQNSPAPSRSLSAEVTTYEAYRKWHSMLPKERQTSLDVLQAYRKHLIDSGASQAEADASIRIIEEQGEKLEIARWNRILTADAPRFNTQPNAFLVERLRDVKPGKALDVGMGQGRNAIYLAQQGWDVTGFDLADEAVELARREAQRLGVRLNAIVADEAKFDWGHEQWDLIVLSYVEVRENAPRVIKALKPGGLVMVEAAHRDATKTQSIGPAIVFDDNELIDLFPGFRVLRYEDEMGLADFGGRAEARLVRLCAQKVR